ncbi:MAG: F0F1 ATP synthase subunit B [Dehalococcoidia bacterium]|nr:F0F1 ATP synthase subunit B [Dehalococcoidia bacterium]
MAGLGIDLPTFVAQLVSFLILMGVLIFVGYRPIRKMLDERANKIKEGMAQAEATREEYVRVRVVVEEEIDKARREAQATVAEASRLGGKLKDEAKREARKEAQVIIDRARKEMEQERERAIDNLRKEFVDTAILVAGKVISETLDAEKHHRLIEKALEESVAFKKN